MQKMGATTGPYLRQRAETRPIARLGTLPTPRYLGTEDDDLGRRPRGRKNLARSLSQKKCVNMRPRLVKEGSPVQDQQGLGESTPPVASSALSDRDNRDRRSSGGGGAASRHANGRTLLSLDLPNANLPSSQPYKLKTHLVIGANGSKDVNSLAAQGTGAEDLGVVGERTEPKEQVEGSAKSSHHYCLGGSNGVPSTNATTTTPETRNVTGNNHEPSRAAGGRRQSSHHYTFGHEQRNSEPMDHEPMDHEAMTDEPTPNHHYVFGQSSHENRQIYSQQIESKPSKPPTQQADDQSPPQFINQASDSSAPLVVLDGANVAYDFAETMKPSLQKREPDPKGIRLAIEYFLKNNCRVVAVVPRSWYQLKPRPGDHYHLKNRGSAESDAKMLTEEVEELRLLRSQGLLVACPPGDDDDAYAIGLARRETDRVLEQQLNEEHDDESMSMEEGDDESFTVSLPSTVFGGYVVSNDFYNDAIRRDDMSKHHQNESLALAARASTLKKWLSLHRISYSFANVGGKDLEFVPNPRNVLIEAIDACRRLNCMR